MKTAIYIEDGIKQIVLTPESDHEKAVLKLLDDQSYEFTVAHGSFYECRGGWVRQQNAYETGMFMDGSPKDDSSTMLVMRKKESKV